jgi:hypothetical protein
MQASHRPVRTATSKPGDSLRVSSTSDCEQIRGRSRASGGRDVVGSDVRAANLTGADGGEDGRIRPVTEGRRQEWRRRPTAGGGAGIFWIEVARLVLVNGGARIFWVTEHMGKTSRPSDGNPS